VRCCTLSAARWSGLSVAGCFVREWVGFSHVAGRTALGGVSVVYRMAASERQRDGLLMPCRCVWRGELDDAQVHRNAMRALRAPGGSTASDRRGRGGTHGKSRAGLAWGIDTRCPEGSGGEVTRCGMDGGLLALLDALGGHVDVQGRRGVAWTSLWGGVNLGLQRRW
jgi:hypothetical protein